MVLILAYPMFMDMTVPKPVTENAVFWYYFRHLISRRVATSAGLCHKPWLVVVVTDCCILRLESSERWTGWLCRSTAGYRRRDKTSNAQYQ